MNNFEEMDNFFEKNNLPKLNQKEIKNPNRPTTSREIETVIKIFQQTKAQDGFTGEFYQKFTQLAITNPTQTLPEHCRGR